MEPNFEKANEIYFRLGIIYKQQQKFNQSLDVSSLPIQLAFHRLIPFQCFKYIVTNPPRPLTEEDIWFQIGHVYEQQKEVRFRLMVFYYYANVSRSLMLQRPLIAGC